MQIGKRRSEAHVIGDYAIDILKQHLPKEWVVREYHPDYGIDLSIELLSEMNHM